MSTRCSVLYGRYGHVFWEQGECAYFWESPRRRYLIRLPFRPFWTWFSMWLYRRRTGRAA